MDFDSLSRRELQAFCKKNKIPANMTNAAMANALKALDIVEGIEEFMQSSLSESAQSTIELLDSSEVTSPYVPPTARSTRRRNALKDDAEDVTSIMTTTRRTTRRTAAKASNVAAMETPVVVAPASRRKVQIASACLKMDSQLKECVEEEEKKDLMTPAAVGVASRRRRAEETEKKVYSTRRSVRLAVNNNVQMLSGEKSGESEVLNNELLFAKDCEDQEVDQKLSGITGVDAIENMEEDKEAAEVVSAEKEDITMGELELDSTREEETTSDFAVEVKPKEEICDDTEYPGHEEVVVLPVDVSDEVGQSEGSVDVPTSEIEVTVEIDAGSQDEDAGDFENKVDAVVSDVDVEVEVVCDDDKEVSVEVDQELNVTLGKLTELRLQQEADAVDLSILPETETIQIEESEKTVVGRVQNSPSKQPSAVPVHEASVEMGNKALLIDFKENMGSGTEMVIIQDTATTKAAKDSGESLRSYEEESLRKLAKMLKEKLQISSKSRNQGNEALPKRSALQVLPVNRMIDGNGNHR